MIRISVKNQQVTYRHSHAPINVPKHTYVTPDALCMFRRCLVVLGDPGDAWVPV